MKMVAIGLSRLGHLKDQMRSRVRNAVANIWRVWVTKAPDDVPVQRPMVRPQVSMGREEQWSRLLSVITGTVQRTTDAGSFHAAAGQQLDLAHYALCNLMDELSAVMAVPARRGPAVVRVLEPRPQRFIEGAWAA